MIELAINKYFFTKNLLSPLSMLSDKATLMFSKNGIESVIGNPENNIILYLKSEKYITESAEINIGDIKKLVRALNCIDQDEVLLKIHPGYIHYETDHFKFKYHTLQPGVIQKHTIDTEKVKNLKIDTVFDISQENFNKILTGTSFASETSKIYFYTRDNRVHANLTDYTNPYADLIGFNVSDSFSGDSLKKEIPINIESLKLINYPNNCSLTVKVNISLNILIFQITGESHTAQYIVSALVK